MLPIMRLNPIVTRVAFPVFSKVQHDIKRLKQGYLVALQILSLINFPIFFGLAMLAPWIVPILFGDGWIPAVILVQILSFIALLRSVANPLGSLLLAKGRADLGFYWNALLLSTQAAGVYLGAKLGGPVGVGLALLALQLLYFVGSYFFLVRKLLGPCLADYLMSMVPQFAISVAMALAIAAIMPLAGQPTIPILTAVVAGGVAVFSGLQLIFRKQQLLELKRFSQEP
jgi:O-antigen/teichoic acid export membrane protein